MHVSTGWQAVVSALKVEKIKRLYGLPSSTQDLYDALYDEPTIQVVQVRHQAAGGFMAMAEALATGRPTVCFAGAGPGVTHLVAPMLEALATCAPVIALSPYVDGRKDGKGAFQETDQLGIMKPVTKWSVRVSHPDKIPWIMHRAFSIATNGKPGPVFIEIPVDVGRVEAEIPAYTPAVQYIRTQGDPAQIQGALKLLQEARKPLIVAGGGARRSGAHDEILALAELLGAPVMTTPSGRGIIEEDNPLAFGQVGLYRTRLGIETTGATDLLITIGSRNEEFQSGSWRHLPAGARLIQIDIDPFELSRNWVPDVPILGDAKLVVSSLVDMLKEKVREEVPSHYEERLRENTQRKRTFEKEVAKECSIETGPLLSKQVVHAINTVFGKSTIMVHENGSQDLWSYYSPYYAVLERDGDIAPGEQTCMGAGVMGSVAVKLARPEKNVVCVAGDGAFQMYNQDVPTAVQHKAPVTWIILNNRKLGWPQRGQTALGDRHIATDFEVQPDFLQMAEAYGCYGERVVAPTEIHGSLQRALEANNAGKPAIVECIIDSDEVGDGFIAYESEK